MKKKSKYSHLPLKNPEEWNSIWENTYIYRATDNGIEYINDKHNKTHSVHYYVHQSVNIEGIRIIWDQNIREIELRWWEKIF